jgi:hypothetical protein
MQYLSNEWLGLVLLAWAVISVIWLTIVIGAMNDAREDRDVNTRARDYHRKHVLQREERIYELINQLREKDELISMLSFELDRIYVAEIAAVPPAAPVTNTDKVLAYAENYGLNRL